MTLDDGLIEALREDYRTAPITEQERVMLDYVVKLTKDATKCSPKDHEALRAVGFDDRGILQITLIASWFNYINRVADALGVGRDELAPNNRPLGLDKPALFSRALHWNTYPLTGSSPIETRQGVTGEGSRLFFY